MGGGGLIEREAYFNFFTQRGGYLKGGLFERGAYLREGLI